MDSAAPSHVDPPGTPTHSYDAPKDDHSHSPGTPAHEH